MGLVLKVRPNERVLINGSVVRNIGHSQMTLEIENRSDVLRGEEILTESMANTPVRRICHLMQLAIVDRDARAGIIDRIHAALDELCAVMGKSCREELSRARRHVNNGNLYNAYRSLLPVIEYEDKLFELARERGSEGKEKT